MENKGVILNLLSVIIMSLTPLMNKFSLINIPPIIASFYNALFSSLFCILLILFSKKGLPIIKNKYIWLIGLTNTLGIVAQYCSLSYLEPITVGLIGRFYIVFSLLLSVIILKEKIQKKDLPTIIFCILGSFFVVDTNATFNNITGIFLAFSYTFLFALTNILAKKLIGSIESTTLLMYNQLISTVLIGIFLTSTNQNIIEYIYNKDIIYLKFQLFVVDF